MSAHPSLPRTRRPVPPLGATVRAGLGRLRDVGAPWWVAAATMLFFIVTVWWLTQDNRVPDFDEGNHLHFAITVSNEVLAGQLTAPFTEFNNYPPLVHLVGAVGLLIAGLHESAVILAANVAFLPLLAGGCYAAGTAAYGRRAGLLAALFALGTPMLVSEMREYYVDPGEAAMVAASVGMILSSRRFERVGLSALAGFTCSLGMLSKETFALFVAGLIVVAILRGGWRNWRGLAAFVLAGAALTLPWYIYHYSELAGLYSGATGGGSAAGNASAGAGITPARGAAANWAWYLWNLLNHQLLAPLTLFFLIGTAVALWRFARRRDPRDLTPELVVGGLVSYVGVTYITLKDPRYSLPALVYLAVLATGWVATAPRRAQAALTGVLGLILAANFAMVSFGWGSTVSITLAGAPTPSVNEARVITFFSPAGYLRGAPARDGDVLGLLRALRRLHFRYFEFDGGSTDSPDFNQNGLGVLSLEADAPEPPWGYDLSQLAPNDVFILRHTPVAGDPPPCQRLLDGTGIYVETGNPLRAPFYSMTFVCPGRRPLYYRRTAPLPESLTHVITGPPAAILLRIFQGMRAQGVRIVEFDGASMITSYMEPIGLQALAAEAGLAVPPTYSPATLGPRDAFMLRHVPVSGDPPPCRRLPDGSGIYIVLGDAAIPFSSYTFYCPLRTPRVYRASGG